LARDALLAEIHAHLLQAQDYGRRHHALGFSGGDGRWRPLLHHPVQPWLPGPHGMLGPKYAWPDSVWAYVDALSYHHQLHETWKTFQGPPPLTPPPLSTLHHDRLLQQPEHARRASLQRGLWHVLTPWASPSDAEAAWELVDPFRMAHPPLQLEDELLVEGGRSVMDGNKRQSRG
jgi:hypothetical protein